MSEDQRVDESSTRTPAEWAALGVALLLLTTVVGIVVWLWVTDLGEPARFTITRGQLRSEKQQFYLPIVVMNTGDETASQVQLQGKLLVDGREEIVDTTFDFVPGHSQVEAILIFSADPGAAEVRVVSYQQP